MLTTVWEAFCAACGEDALTVELGGEHDDGDRIGLPCPTCQRDGVIAYQLRQHRRREKKRRGKRIF